MVTLDRIRLTGLLRRKPRQRGFFYGATTTVRMNLRVARPHGEQLGRPSARIVARPVLCAPIVHSRKPGSTKYSTGVSSTAFVLTAGSDQRHRFDSRSVASSPFASRMTFPEAACVSGGRSAADAVTATIEPNANATVTGQMRVIPTL